MELVIEKAALKGLRKMPSKMAMALQARLEAEKDAFRLRQGDWRAVYRIARERAQMRVVLVDVRGGIYR